MSPEELNDVDVRDKIFEEVVGEDGHSRALCMGVGIQPAPKRLKATPSSSQHYKVDIARLRQEAEKREKHDQEREICHQEKLQQVRAEMNEKMTKTTKNFINLMRRAGISIIPDDDTGTSR